MPTEPSAPGDFIHYLGYWASLQSFLAFSFGWSRHDRGLTWLLTQPELPDDPRFAVLDTVWGRNGDLERYLEWCLHVGAQNSAIRFLGCDADLSPLIVEGALSIKLAGIRREMQQTALPLTPHGKHLERGDHVKGPAERKAGDAGCLRTINGSPPRAVYVRQHFGGWYTGLAEAAAALPPSSRSWRVDVFVRSVGFLGTYRKSRTTGLWFSGRHRYHSVGN
ncbi:hypothetical protein [Microbacterium sp. VKM Ac-2923]|uniref:hypothetical protein n=1 Tax=Microbacterium sp. VKM Ac-2923 TaxID=2929476 RepID=UPI001FB30C0A|nr:hypothetical protein [Microbacterium sp. VKM Ac-2923]MCJ1708533.1 hypothetical protein [Microbacterium sp. VKM Ac-2923]